MTKERSIDTLLLDGGCACFNFVNTVHSRNEEGDPYDYLGTYRQVMQWCSRVELLSEKRINELAAYAKNHPGVTQEALQEIRDTRKMLYEFFSLIAAGKPVEEQQLECFNTKLSESMSRVRFLADGRKLRVGWKPGNKDLTEPLWRVLKSAYDILTEEPFDRIKECEACGWVFLDQSKNKSRRWCNMQTCGSIHKAKKYYYRKKKEEESET